MPADTRVTPPFPGLSPVAGKPIIARFDGGSLSSDGGLLVLREVENRRGVAQRLAACIDHSRAPERIQHSLAEMLRFHLLSRAADVPYQSIESQPTRPAMSTLPTPTTPAAISRSDHTSTHHRMAAATHSNP